MTNALANLWAAFVSGFNTIFAGNGTIPGITKGVVDGVDQLIVADATTGAITTVAGVLVGLIGMFVVVRLVTGIYNKLRGRM